MIRIITDSAADFELWELEKRDITCIPLVVMFKETEYHENVNLTKAEFYDLLAATKTLPKTAQASPQILLDLFEQAKAALLPTVSAPWATTFPTNASFRSAPPSAPTSASMPSALCISQRNKELDARVQ